MYHNRKITGGLLTWAIRLLPVATLFACTAAVAAQGDMAAPASDVSTSNMAGDSNQVQSGDELRESLAFQKETTIKDALLVLQERYQKNIVPSAGVSGLLTVPRLYNVTFEEALNAVLGYGFKYEHDGDFIRVYTTQEYKTIKADPERMVHKVITLYYITAEEAAKLIQPVLSDAAKITTSTPAEKDISSGGSSGGSGGGGSGSLSGGGGGDNMANNDMIVVFDYPERIEQAEKVIRDIDERPKQVLIEATILSATLTEETKFGIDWNLLSGVAIDGYPSTLGATQGTFMETAGFANPALGGLHVGLSAENVQAILTALETVTDVTVLANPKILALNKQEGSVLIGKKLGYLNQTTQTQTSTTQSVDFLETGTRLVFRPYIGNDGYIRMDIYPKDSDGSVVNALPSETTTELKTNVMVKDGETVVLGGLFRDSVSTGRGQVPVLGSLPLVGALFRGSDDISKREEVIIMLTPHIIGEPSDTGGADRAEDVRMKMEGARDTLQYFDRAKMAENSYAKAARFYLEGDVQSAMFHVKVALMIRPNYLEARRLYERMVTETDPEELKKIDSIVEQAIDQQQAANWRR